MNNCICNCGNWECILVAGARFGVGGTLHRYYALSGQVPDLAKEGTRRTWSKLQSNPCPQSSHIQYELEEEHPMAHS